MQSRRALIFLMFAFLLPSCTRTPPAPLPPPAPFVDLAAIIPDAIIDIKYATKDNFVGEILDGYLANRAWGLPETSEALRQAADRLRKDGYRLKIHDFYRPMRAEAHMLRWANATGHQSLIGTYIPRAVLPDSPVGHTCGNMVDLTIVHLDGSPVDMGTPYDTLNETAWTLHASGSVLENRLRLKAAMEAAGFLHNYMEWWHFNYFKVRGKAMDVVIQ